MQPVNRSNTAIGVTSSANELLRKTYMLLGGTLVFSGLTAYYAMVTNAAPVSIVILLVGYFGLLFATNALRKSPWGIVAVFALTGFMGYTLGPIINMYLHQYANGQQIVFTALGSTGLIFFALSAYTITTKKDFSYLGGFLMVAITGAVLLSLIGFFFHAPMLSLVVSGAFILLSSGLILFQTSLIVNGGETSYIMATVTLYVALFNLFVSLLNILGAFSGRSN
jgi:modulator of FtsH protease